jgi:hypothetical protein
MATCDLTNQAMVKPTAAMASPADLAPSRQAAAANAAVSKQATISSQDALDQLKALVHQDPAFAAALRASSSTHAAAQLAATEGIAVTPEALWRNRGTLVSGGLPTWRG